MFSIFSGALSSLANLFSGADAKATFILFFDDIECPKELIK